MIRQEIASKQHVKENQVQFQHRLVVADKKNMNSGNRGKGVIFKCYFLLKAHVTGHPS